MSDAIRQRLRDWLEVTLQKPSTQEAVERLDSVIAEMDEARKEARALLESTTGDDHDEVRAALGTLEKKRAEATTTRAQIVGRMERLEQVKALTIELAALNERELTSEDRARVAQIYAAVDAITRE